MQTARAPFYKRPKYLLLIFFIGIVFIWVTYYAWMVITNYELMKTGQKDVLSATTVVKTEEIIKRLFAGSILTKDVFNLLNKGDNPTLGNPKAKIKIVQFIDWDCDKCAKGAESVRSFMEKHKDDVYFVLRDYPILELHPDAVKVAIAARCVYFQNDLEKFWRFHDVLYKTQGSHAENDLRRYAMQIGADVASYDKCIDAKVPLTSINESIKDAEMLGVIGTPTFFFNGVKIQGAMEFDLLELAVKEAKKKID